MIAEMSAAILAGNLPSSHSSAEGERVGEQSSARSESAADGNTIVIGAVQLKPLDGKTPYLTAVANAKQILMTSVNTTILYNKPERANDKLGNIELLDFPEFSAFGSKGVSVHCSANPAQRFEQLDGFCEDVPPAGTVIDCHGVSFDDTDLSKWGLLSSASSSSRGDSDKNDGVTGDASRATVPPYKIIACGLLRAAEEGKTIYPSASKVLQKLAVSYNTCQRNPKGFNPSAPSYYNTQVVVGAGRILAVYPKFHPFFTNCFDKPSLQLTTFNTLTSNATFGLFICFDIMFEDPKDLLVKKGIKYFSYSAAIPLVFQTVVGGFSGMNGVIVAASNMDGSSTVFVDGKSVAVNSASGCPMTVGPQPCVALASVPLRK